MSRDESLGSDRLRGVPRIARFLGENERRTYYLLERGLIPAGKEGTSWISSKSALREYHRKITNGKEPHG